jgi:hypothetical protein
MNKVFYCEICDAVDITNYKKPKCKDCRVDLTEIGFFSNIAIKGTKNIGGSLTPGFCKCGKPQTMKGYDKQGRKTYRSQCNSCREASLKYPRNACEQCKTKSDGKGNIHVDHIDGDRSNNDVSNLQALCVSCHKVKTQEDWKNKSYSTDENGNLIKRCNKCDNHLPVTSFYKHKSRLGGYQSYCKDCHKTTNGNNRNKRIAQGIDNSVESKVCKSCSSKKPISQFGIKRDEVDGYNSNCKTCWAAYIKKVRSVKKK